MTGLAAPASLKGDWTTKTSSVYDVYTPETTKSEFATMLVPLKSLFGLSAFDEPVPPGSSRDVAMLLAENPHLTAAFEHAQPAAPGSKPDTQAPEPSYTPTVTPMPGM